jgi:hypothetical protein
MAPLHLAVANGAMAMLVEDLLRVSPHSACEQCAVDAQWPLHLAALCGASHDIIAVLLRDAACGQRTVRAFDGAGRLPLHCAIEVRNCRG